MITLPGLKCCKKTASYYGGWYFLKDVLLSGLVVMQSGTQWPGR